MTDRELERMRGDFVAHRDKIDKRFEQHMKREEESFDKFYAALRDLESKITDLLANGLKNMASLDKALTEKMDAKIKEVVAGLVTRREVWVGWAVMGATAISMIYLFSTFSMTESENRAVHRLATEVKALAASIQQQKQGGTNNVNP